jgi:hypothetical protein
MADFRYQFTVNLRGKIHSARPLSDEERVQLGHIFRDGFKEDVVDVADRTGMPIGVEAECDVGITAVEEVFAGGVVQKPPSQPPIYS